MCNAHPTGQHDLCKLHSRQRKSVGAHETARGQTLPLSWVLQNCKDGSVSPQLICELLSSGTASFVAGRLRS